MIRAAENAKSFKKAGNLRNPKNWLERFSEFLPEEWAFDPLEESVDNKPDSASAWFLLGEEEYERGYFCDALTSFGKAVELEPDYAEAFLGSAKSSLALREYSAVIKHSSDAIAFDPEMIEAYSVRGFAYERLQEYEEAIKNHNTALILKEQPVRAKPRRSLTSEIIGKVYRFCEAKIARPVGRKIDEIIRSKVVPQKLKAVRAGIANNIRAAMKKVGSSSKGKIKTKSKVKTKTKRKK